jgi:translation initiation factor IF-3
VRLVDESGVQMGVVPIQEALKLAVERGYDLVEVSPGSTPPVCRIMDYRKYKYQMSKKHAARKTVDVKEVKIRPQISDHDFQLKVKNMRRFLDDGDKAKVTMFFRGREIVRPDIGMKLFERVLEILPGKYQVESPARLEGKSITMVLAPSSK